MRQPASALELDLEIEQRAFEPGGRLSGVASWSAAVVPRGFELRLCWVTAGKGGRDLRIADSVLLPQPQAVERRPFILNLPLGPYSFRGELVSLSWWLDLIALPGEERTRVELVIAPGRETIDIGDRRA